MKLSFKITFATMLLLLSINFVNAQNIKKGFKYLEKKDFLNAGNEFQNALILNETDIYANYGLALIYFNPDNKDYDAVKAYRFIKSAEENIKKMTLKETSKFGSIANEEQIMNQKIIIEDAFLNLQFENAQQANTVEAYQNFIERFAGCAYIPQIIALRNALAFKTAKEANKINAYEDFIQSYPEAEQITEACLLRDALAFAEAKKTNTVEAYTSFIKNYPIAKQVKEALYYKEIKEIYTKDYLLGKIYPASHPLFESVDEKYLSYNKNLYLRIEAYQAFIKMHEAAQREGIDLVIISATRNFHDQKNIWMRKWESFTHEPTERVRNIMIYNSMPGISRHHWGTDIDLNALSESYFETERGGKVYEWLANNAHAYGFFQPYTAFGSNRQTGYTEEKWHWSYLPLSRICLDEYIQCVNYNDIQDFSGADQAEFLKVIEHYVMGIDESLLKK